LAPVSANIDRIHDLILRGLGVHAKLLP